MRESDGNWRCRRELFLSLFSTTDCVSSILPVDSSNLREKKEPSEDSKLFLLRVKFFPPEHAFSALGILRLDVESGKNSTKFEYIHVHLTLPFSFAFNFSSLHGFHVYSSPAQN